MRCSSLKHLVCEWIDLAQNRAKW